MEVASNLNAPELVAFDLSTRSYPSVASFTQVVDAVMEDICAMPMGADDCSYKSTCIENPEGDATASDGECSLDAGSATVGSTVSQTMIVVFAGMLNW